MLSPMAFGSLGWPEILVILGIVVILFGAKRIPELAKGLGEGMREFRKGMKDGGKEE